MTDTEEKIYSGSTTSIYTDRLLIQSERTIHFKDIIGIKAIPCYFRSSPYSDESDVDYFIEILTLNNKRLMLNQGEHYFIQAFQVSSCAI